MSNYRSIHRDKIKQILESVTYDVGGNTVNLLAYKYYTRDASQYPYAYVSSLDLVSNTDGGSLYDTGTYNTQRNYLISLVFRIDDTEESVQGVEALMDELEEKILEKFRGRDVRDSLIFASPDWADLKIGSFSQPISGDELQLSNDLVFKTVQIQIETPEEFN